MARITMTTEMMRGRIIIENETTKDPSIYTCSASGFESVEIEATTPQEALMNFMQNIGNLRRDPAWKAKNAALAAERSERMKKNWQAGKFGKPDAKPKSAPVAKVV